MRFVGCLLLAALCVLAAPREACSTAGFAEWDVYTPGGHMISHNDVWKERHGDCLRSDARPDVGQAQVFVSHLSRWRYYRDHVAGETREGGVDGYFVFNEIDETVRRFGTRPDFLTALNALQPRKPMSPWLTGADGWREAWFPFMVWKPCRALLAGDPAPAILSEAECRAALAPERLELYRRTTWGRICSQRRTEAPSADPATATFNDFCDELQSPE